MPAPALALVRTQDLPVCLPGRQCVDQSPLGADLVNALSALTPLSPAIAAGAFAVLGASIVLVALGLRLQRRGSGVRPWLVVLLVALVLVGVATSAAVRVRSDTISLIYSDVFGQPRAPAPASLDGSWPSVLVAAEAMVVVGVAAIAAIAVVAAHRRRGGVEHLRRTA